MVTRLEGVKYMLGNLLYEGCRSNVSKEELLQAVHKVYKLAGGIEGFRFPKPNPPKPENKELDSHSQ